METNKEFNIGDVVVMEHPNGNFIEVIGEILPYQYGIDCSLCNGEFHMYGKPYPRTGKNTVRPATEEEKSKLRVALFIEGCSWSLEKNCMEYTFGEEDDY